jgi:hypothetical protein
MFQENSREISGAAGSPGKCLAERGVCALDEGVCIKPVIGIDLAFLLTNHNHMVMVLV